MEEIMRLKANLDRMMEEGLDDEVLDNLISVSLGAEELNEAIEYEVS